MRSLGAHSIHGLHKVRLSVVLGIQSPCLLSTYPVCQSVKPTNTATASHMANLRRKTLVELVSRTYLLNCNSLTTPHPEENDAPQFPTFIKLLSDSRFIRSNTSSVPIYYVSTLKHFGIASTSYDPSL
jgi:hypothetical protein